MTLSKIAVTLLLFITSLTAAAESCTEKWEGIKENHIVPSQFDSIIGHCGPSLQQKLQVILKDNQRPLHYNQAKKALTREIDNRGPEGVACSVYSPADCMNNTALNLEHTWPRSKGAGKKPAISDLHHLYMAQTTTNSVRSNFPFCNVLRPTWEHGGSKLGRSAHSHQQCFEPPTFHKGNVARSMFYFSIRYNRRIGKTQEQFLRMWHESDLVNEDDVIRNELITEFQGNTNPFIIMPYLTKVIFNF